VLTWSSTAGAIDVHISADTIAQGYQLIASDGDVIQRSRLNQFLGIGLYDMSGDGTGRYSFVTQMRFDSDFGITKADAQNIEQLKNNNLSILYAYFDIKDIGGFMDLRLGRQLLVDQLDYTMMDGARFTFHTGLNFAVSVFAGTEVKNAGFLSVINSTQLEVDGSGGFDDDIDDEVGIVVGASLALEGLRDHHGNFTYRRIMTPPVSDPANPGTKKIFVDTERVGGSYHWRIIPQLHLSAAWGYEIALGSLTDARVGLRSPKIADVLDIELFYWHLVPTFEGSSIFNIFSTEPINDVNLRLRYHFAKGVSAYVGGYARLFGQGPDVRGDPAANDDPAVVEAVTDLGAVAGARATIGRYGRFALDANYLSGYGQQATIDMRGGYGFLDGALDVSGGLTTVVFDDELLDALEDISFGAHLRLSYQIRDMARFHVIAELNSNNIERVQYRMYGLIDLDFWL
jgi:hypothetical protein